MKTRKATKSVLPLLLALAMMLGLLTGCGGSSSDGTSDSGSGSSASSSADSSATEGGDADASGDEEGADNDASIVSTDYDNSVQIDSLTYIQDTDITSLVPWDVRTLTPGIAYEVYEMLFGVDSNGEYYPVLADATRGDYMPGMDHEEGSSDYTIYIYDYIYDSAGHHITADDVKFSFDMARDGGFESGWGSFESEEVIDETTIVLHCTEELTKMGELQNIICRTYIFSEEAYNESPSGLSADACGTGPYTVESFTASTELIVTKRDDYWQTNEELKQQIQQANVGTITLTLLTESTQEVIGLETGTIDLAEKISADNVDQLVADGYGDSFNTYSSQSNMIVYAYCNVDEASLCSNVALRKAILMAIDNEALAAFEGNGMVACTTLGNSFFADYDTSWEGAYSLYQSADEATIQSLLDEAGYNGETLKLLTATYCGDYAEIIEGQLEAYGINVELYVMDGGTCNTMKADPTEWDIFYQYMAADDYVVNLWSHLIDADGRSNGATENFIVDDTLQDLLHTCMASETHTAENMDAFLQYVDDNAYVKALVTGSDILLYPDYVSTVFKTDKGYIVPGACCFTE
ncbi:MAG: ABC transporter substrate-binding protein [Clostridiales bacterium]|nr:ABC transporter substrate-binding protein [Clostridiales bacterium]